MKWINHRVISTSLAYLITSSLPFAAGAYMGSTFPDAIEGNLGKPLSFKYHRQVSHQVLLYIIPLLCISVINLIPFPSFIHQILVFIMGFFYGAILHIIEDALTGTVPHPLYANKRIGKQVFKVGSIEEYIISYVFLGSLIISLLIL